MLPLATTVELVVMAPVAAIGPVLMLAELTTPLDITLAPRMLPLLVIVPPTPMLIPVNKLAYTLALITLPKILPEALIVPSGSAVLESLLSNTYLS